MTDKVKVSRANLDEALERAQAAEEALGDVWALEVHCAHIAVSYVDYPNGQIGLDVCGNIVEINLTEPAWVVTE